MSGFAISTVAMPPGCIAWPGPGPGPGPGPFDGGNGGSALFSSVGAGLLSGRLERWLILSSIVFLNASDSCSLAKFRPTWQSSAEKV